MVTYKRLRDAHSAAMESIALELENGIQPSAVYVLRRDGDTDVFAVAANKIVRHRECGWLTRGNSVDQSDMPCII